MISPTGHTLETLDEVAATCTETGLTAGSRCKVCGEVLVAQEVIPALGHDFGAWNISKPATCTEAGEKLRECSRCGMTETEEVPAADCATESFSDMKDKTLWYHDYMDIAVSNGWLKGIGNNLLDPNGNVTRAQFVTMLYRISGEPSVEGKTTDFTDLVKDGWYVDAVIWAVDQGIVKGITTTTFEPETEISREQITLILYRMAGSPDVEASKLDGFKDSAEIANWATDAMAWAVNEGILNGSNGMLFPKDNATRAEVAAILLRSVRVPF